MQGRQKEVQDVNVAISTSIEKSEFSGANVIGIIEGSDPVLKKECIIYTESSELLNIMYASAKESGLTIKDMGRDIPAGSSDHVPFREKGIPSLCFHSGIHADLHGPGDDVNKIDFDKMERSSKLAFLIGYQIANQRERIVIDKPDK